jgi:hypothetical protein
VIPYGIDLLTLSASELALEYAIGKISPGFPGESRDPFLRRSKLLNQLKDLASEDGLVPQNDRPRFSPGKRKK